MTADNHDPASEKPAQTPPPTTPAEDAGLHGGDAESIFQAIRRGEFLSGVADGRDVSLIYIDRRVQSFFGAERERDWRQPRPGPQPAPPPVSRRIGDLVVNPVPRWEVERLASVFEQPPAYTAARQRLNQGLLILHGRSDSGKRAAAIHLLGELLFKQGEGVVYELNPDLRLADLRPDDLPAHTALLLETPGGAALQGLTAFQLNALERVLSPLERNNALVIITDRLPAPFPATHNHLLQAWDWRWPGDATEIQRKIVDNHIRYFTCNDADYNGTIVPQLEQLAALAPLNELLAETLPPGQLADLAELLLPVLRGEQTVEQALAQLHQRAIRDVEAWFEASHEAELENLLIAAAVFNGAAYADVSQAAEALETLLPKAKEPLPPAWSAKREPPPPSSRFGRSDPRQKRLAAIHASLASLPQQTHYGEVLQDAIQLDNSAWQEAVLRFVWEFDEMRQPLLDWLKRYGAHPRHSLRTRAAAAIGALARHHFASIEADVLRQWAGSPDANMRRSAAQVLGITIWDEAHSAAAARLLHYWAGQNDQPRWQWTAAAAYAGLAGPRYPAQTLSDLRLIAANSHHHPALLDPLFRALLNAYAAAQGLPDRRLAVLDELAGWPRQEAGDRRQKEPAFAVRRVAVLAFWIMLWPDAHDPVWRLLLADAGAAGLYQDRVVALMREALNFRQPKGSVFDSLHPRKMALEGLERLVVEVVRLGDSAQMTQLENLLTALIDTSARADPAEVDRLNYQAEQWSRDHAEAKSMFSILRSIPTI